MINSSKDLNAIVALARHRGFVFQGSEIYGGLANSWDYGPLGVLMLNNIKAAWWKKFVRQSPTNVGLDSGILMNPQVWVASGHVGTFNDPLMDCRACNDRFRADKIIEDFAKAKGLEVQVEGKTDDELYALMQEHAIPCPSCGKRDFTPIRRFNLMFKTFQGVDEDTAATVYLRPETAQGIFVQYKNIQRSMRLKVPFGVGQIGKSFRNEITPRNFIFRTREFEQMELEFFCKPGTELEWFDYWRDFCETWLTSLGLRPESIKRRDHEAEELSHYSNATTDFEFMFPSLGWGELWGIASRTNFDLTAHSNESGENMEYQDPITNEKYVPYVIEPSLGANRMLLAFLCDAYDVENLEGGDERTVLHLHPAIAPYTAAVLPLQKKLSESARTLWATLSETLDIDFDESGSIGKRYRRQDEAGTPYCITVDFDTQETGNVTIRDRDTMQQITLPMDQVGAWLAEKRKF